MSDSRFIFFMSFICLLFWSEEIQFTEKCKQMNSETYLLYHQTNTVMCFWEFSRQLFHLVWLYYDISIQPTLEESRKGHVMVFIALVCELKCKLTSCSRIKECKQHSSQTFFSGFTVLECKCLRHVLLNRTVYSSFAFKKKASYLILFVILNITLMLKWVLILQP